MFFKSNVTISAILISALVLLLGCEGKGMENPKANFASIKDVPQEKWDTLAQKKIYFGHQSVGFNILDGILDILNENPQIRLSITETNDVANVSHGIFAHSRIGENEKPFTKINDFSSHINNRLGNTIDIAFFKFCYIDVSAQTDIQSLFESYKKNFSSLKSTYPEIIFVHFTVPLTVVQKGPKAWIKKVIGKQIGGYQDNAKRNEYNNLLLKEYSGVDPIFDLARLEGTHPDNTLETFTHNGRQYYALTLEYALEEVMGRHLNKRGSRFIAEQLLVFLAEI